MKKISVLICTCYIFLSSSPVYSMGYSNTAIVWNNQDEPLQIQNIVFALKNVDAEKLGTFFGEAIDIKLPEADEIRNISKSQAVIALKYFFNEKKITGFDLTSQRELGNTKYIAGKLKGNSDYNVTIIVRSENIITIRIN